MPSVLPTGTVGSASPCEITDISEKESRLSVLIVSAGQPQDWIDFPEAAFSLGKPEESAFPEFAERKWVQYLLVELPNGGSYFFAEKLVEKTFDPALMCARPYRNKIAW
ncbi:MAG: hypothetical protein WA646_14660 [Candidatus Sulfotelmatobacter sp.]